MRLTKALRDEIVERVVEYRLANEKGWLEALEQRYLEMTDEDGKRLWELIYGKEKIALLSTRFDGMFPKRSTAKISLEASGSVTEVGWGTRKVPNYHEWTTSVVGVAPAGSEAERLVGRLREAKAAVKDYREEYAGLVNRARLDLASALSNFSTVKKLCDEWPEIAAFVPSVTPAGLPATTINTLNQQFGLPKEKTSA